MRIILFTGKGGVGKTTISAATALQAARRGLRTLVLSTDPAHSLADALDRTLSPEPVEVLPNLYAQELDVYYSMKKHWSSVRDLMQLVFRWQGMQNVVAEELSALPGMEEASAFLWLDEYYHQKNFDLIILDSAPTGETLSLLSLPQVTQSWIMKAFPGQRLAMKGLGAMVRTMTGIPLDKGLDELDKLFQKLDRVQEIMHNPDIASIRLVMNPERMVIREAQRAYAYLMLYGYHVDAAIINRVFPETAAGGPFESYLASQGKYLEEIENAFAPMPILRVPHQGREVFGLPLLEEIGETLYQGLAPEGVLFSEKPMLIEETSTGYRISFKMPFIQAEQVTLEKYGDELVLTVGNQRRNLILPRFAHYLQLAGWSIESPWLRVELAR